MASLCSCCAKRPSAPRGIAAGAAALIGTRPASLIAAVARALGNPLVLERMKRSESPYGDGRASERCAEVLMTGQLTDAFGAPRARIARNKRTPELEVAPCVS